MTVFSYQITSTPYHIKSTGFIIRQFSIRNPTPYPIYININSFTPNKDNYDYLIQPNTSVFVSNAIETKEITIVPATLVTRDTIVTMVVSSDATLQPAGVPQFSPQFTSSLAGYPYTIPVGTNGTLVLPEFTVDKFLPVFFLMENLTLGLDGTPFLLRDFATPIGIFPQAGGVISYLPTAIPKTMMPRIETIIATTTLAYINAIQSPEPFDDLYLSARTLNQIDHLTNRTFYFAARPPAGIFSLGVMAVSGAAYNITVDLTISGGETIFNINFAGNAANLIALLRPRVILSNAIDFYILTITNNHATQDTYVSPVYAPV